MQFMLQINFFVPRGIQPLSSTLCFNLSQNAVTLISSLK